MKFIIEQRQRVVITSVADEPQEIETTYNLSQANRGDNQSPTNRRKLKSRTNWASAIVVKMSVSDEE